MNTTGAGPRRPPIGHVLRTLDRLIEDRFERTLGGRGLTRRQWQILNVLADGPRTVPALAAALAPFLDPAAGDPLQPHLEPLAADGRVRRDGDTVTLTAAGRDLLAGLRSEVETIRELTTAGLDEQEYDRTVATLETMISNLRTAPV